MLKLMVISMSMRKDTVTIKVQEQVVMQLIFLEEVVVLMVVMEEMDNTGISGGTAYGSITAPATIGSGGGSYSITRHGGRGGGYARLDVSGTLTVTGDITANGGDGLTDGGGQSGGGGAGGGIYITTGTLSGAGTISVDGGAGGNSGGGTDGGGGAGGRIAIYYTTNSHTGSMTAYGGSGPDAAGYGGAGTIYLKDSGETYGDLIIDNNNQTETSRPLWDHFYGTTPLATTTTFNSVTIRNKGELTVNNGVTLDYDTLTWNDDGTIAENGTVNFGSDLTIPDGATYEANVSKTFGSLTVNGVLTHSYNINSQTYTLDITVDNDLTIASTGSIDLNERGYSYSQGTGAGSDAADFSGGGGGAYGGDGGDGEAGISGGNAYGSITAPAAIGSGGGSYSITRHGGRGGGYARLDVSGTLTVTGDITANGGDGLIPAVICSKWWRWFWWRHLHHNGYINWCRNDFCQRWCWWKWVIALMVEVESRREDCH